jgi:hypothetical protein
MNVVLLSSVVTSGGTVMDGNRKGRHCCAGALELS